MGRYISLFLCAVLWLVRIIAWTTPNNVLHQHGFDNLVHVDFIFSSLVGLVLGTRFKEREGFRINLVFYAHQVLALGLFLVPAILLALLFIASLFFGLTV